jgi:hypothetical protein
MSRGWSTSTVTRGPRHEGAARAPCRHRIDGCRSAVSGGGTGRSLSTVNDGRLVRSDFGDGQTVAQSWSIGLTPITAEPRWWQNRSAVYSAVAGGDPWWHSHPPTILARVWCSKNLALSPNPTFATTEPNNAFTCLIESSTAPAGQGVQLAQVFGNLVRLYDCAADEVVKLRT